MPHIASRERLAKRNPTRSYPWDLCAERHEQAHECWNERNELVQAVATNRATNVSIRSAASETSGREESCGASGARN